MKRRAFIESLSLPFLSFAVSPKSIDIDPGGCITIGGKRQFVLGSYQLPNVTNPWQQLQGAGFNLLKVLPEQKNLDRAREYGLHTWITLGSIPSRDRIKSEERIRRIVMAFKDHPSLLSWETEDEPRFVWKNTGPRVPAADIIATCRFVKGIDPVHLFYLNHAPTNLVPTLQKYNAGADIIATDIYPVIPHGIREHYALWPDGEQGDLLNRYISQVGEYADKMRRVAGPSRAVFMVLQAFAWENLRKKDRDPKMILYPTRAQTRFMAYQSIVHGVNGIIYWGLAYTPQEAHFWSDLKSVTQELHQLQSELSAPRVKLPLQLEYHDTGHDLDQGIQWIAKPSGEDMVLLAVNADPNPVDATFHGLQAFEAAKVLFEPRQISLNGSSLRDRFSPFDVHLYRLAKRRNLENPSVYR